MRTKLVPDVPKPPAGGTVSIMDKPWVMWAAIGAGVLVVGYIVLNAQGQTNSGSGTGTVSVGSPVQYGTASTAPASTNSGTGSASSSSGTSSALVAAINAETASNNAEQQTALASIQQTTQVALANDQTTIQTAEIGQQVSNYANSTNVLDNFLKQTPGITGVGGNISPTSTGGVSVDILGYTGGQHPTPQNLIGLNAFQNLVTTGSQNTSGKGAT